MKYRLLTGAALMAATVLGGCTAGPGDPYSQYGYGYAPGYSPARYYAPGYHASSYYEPVPGSYSYRYRPFYSPDYNSSFDTYRTTGGGNG
jgi:hypothetical protein